MKALAKVLRELKTLEKEIRGVPTKHGKVSHSASVSAGYLVGVCHALNWVISEGPAAPSEAWSKTFKSWSRGDDGND